MLWLSGYKYYGSKYKNCLPILVKSSVDMGTPRNLIPNSPQCTGTNKESRPRSALFIIDGLLALGLLFILEIRFPVFEACAYTFNEITGSGNNPFISSSYI